MKSKSFHISVVLLALLILSSACGTAGKPADMAENAVLTFTDDLGREVSVSSVDSVAALIGSFADIWCTAGGKESLVAAANDSWTSFDLDLDDSVINLGEIKTPNIESLFAADPDLVLASINTDSNLKLLDSFEKSGITVAYFDVQTFSDYLRMMKICTSLTGRSDLYEEFGETIRSQIQSTLAKVSGEGPSVLCIRATGLSCKVKGSSDNVLGEMLKDLKCTNIADGNGSLLENLSLEAILSADPQYIFVVLQGADQSKAQLVLDETLLNNPAWSSLSAVKEGRFYILDNRLYNLKPNSLWGEAYEKLFNIIYAE